MSNGILVHVHTSLGSCIRTARASRRLYRSSLTICLSNSKLGRHYVAPLSTLNKDRWARSDAKTWRRNYGRRWELIRRVPL